MKRGPKPLPAEELRDSWYKFRVNQAERELLEEVGHSDFWRGFNLHVAAIIKTGGTLDSIRKVVGMHLLNDNDERLEYWNRVKDVRDSEEVKRIFEEEMKKDNTT